MRLGHSGVLISVVAALIAFAPAARACSVCNLSNSTTTVNGVTYFYQTGGCANPGSYQWGNQDCHTWYEYDAEAGVNITVECDASGYACLYVEVTGGGGGGSSNDPFGPGQRDPSGYCPPWYSYCE